MIFIINLNFNHKEVKNAPDGRKKERINKSLPASG